MGGFERIKAAVFLHPDKVALPAFAGYEAEITVHETGLIMCRMRAI